MGIYERISDNREKIESIYDLAAICYDYLLERIDNQLLFVGDYIECSDGARENNPNIRRLKKFAYEISRLFLQKDKKYSMNKIVEKTLEGIVSVKGGMESYGTEIYNEATIAYHLLQAVDLYAENRSESSLRAPLNKKYSESSYIYRCSGEDILAEAAVQLDFREKIHVTEIRNEFKCLRILEKTELDNGMEPPAFVTLYIDAFDPDRRAVLDDKKIKIAMIPFGKEELITFERVRGNSFCIKYIEECKQTAVKRALRMLETAIRQNANMIIFPEYVCFPEMQEEIGNYLWETYRKFPGRMKHLLLVIAGSGWSEDGNNVSQVYSYSGKLLGEQYKYAPYDEIDEDGNRWVEQLQKPGKKSIIVQIPGLGTVMTAICRDVSNRGKTEKMANIFKTNFIMVPAWSKSLYGGFETQLGNITETNMTTNSLVCNCCGAVEDEDNLKRGLAVTPHKKRSIIKAKTQIIESKAERCQECAGCIFSVLFSFRSQHVEKGKIVNRITQKDL